ncbi:hypothetical protein KDA_49340 [Dictyobacter alpinus]|uniref:HTH cro/C1-type domain-containing protein n=1 Tax=Dictyobacter alpinus TaxID=2014873 RepID=A0A402BDS5_9CHLR|nr:helix-turn-helix domain-containing protein [Dictyobacter alpinus]GCE29450.1 hypothetical protein KDA_49340 [Dictyobacter alpinus]
MVHNNSLRFERDQRGWSQSKVAGLIETSPLSISQWERGIFLPSPHFREKLCALFEKDAYALGILLQTDSEQSHISDPFIPSQSFPALGLVGRDALLNLLADRLSSEIFSSTVTLYGLPGVGKTALALALTEVSSVQEIFSGGVLWAGVGLNPHLFEQLFHWGNLLQIPEQEMKECADLPSLAKCLRAHIGSRKLLFVLDDIWHLEDFQTLQVGGVNCTYLVTTRLPRLAAQLGEQNTFHVPELEKIEGTTLLARFLSHLAEWKPQAIESLVQEVGGLPLALTLIGKSLFASDQSEDLERIQASLQRLQDVSARLQLSEPQSLVEHHPSLPPERFISLETIISISVQQLSSQAREALKYLAIIPAKPNSFSQELVNVLISNGGEEFNELLDIGLIEVHENGRYTLHPAIADYARSTLHQEEHEQKNVKQCFIDRVVSWLQNNSENYAQIEQEYSNLCMALELAIEQGLQTDKYVQLITFLMPF